MKKNTLGVTHARYTPSEGNQLDLEVRKQNDSLYQSEGLMAKARDQFALSQIDLEVLQKRDPEDEDDIRLADA
jgi:hypothetical protein